MANDSWYNSLFGDLFGSTSNKPVADQEFKYVGVDNTGNNVVVDQSKLATVKPGSVSTVLNKDGTAYAGDAQSGSGLGLSSLSGLASYAAPAADAVQAWTAYNQYKDMKPVLGAQKDLMQQQIKSNKQAMADRKQFNSTWANASNGLAARSV